MYKSKNVSLVLPAFNEEKAIEKTIREFQKVDIFDEIIVVDNNSSDKTSQIAKKCGVIVVSEKRQGYGYALRRGYSEANSDLIISCDVDGTYDANDVKYLLKLSNKYDFVFGSRPRAKKQWLRGSNMTFIRRFTNRLISSFINILFGGKSLTDLGCTFRLMNKKSYLKIKDYFHIGGAHFQPELTILALINGVSITEVPVHYKERIGESKLSGTFSQGFKLAWRMLALIFWYKLGVIIGVLPLIHAERN